jgi:hypothetical protein
MRSLCALVTLVATALPVRTAIADDAAGALGELKQGYVLKQQGNCREAIPHLARSLELDPKPKAALNLADCERQVGDLVAARDHAALGRDLAHQLNDAELATVADEQLGAIDKRLPLLTIRLASGAPTACTIERDGSVVEMRSLGVPIEVNPGTHTIALHAPGFMDRRFRTTIAEGERAEIEVEPGPRLRSSAVQVTATSPEHAAQSPPPLVYGAYGALGLGAVGLTIGIVAGLAAVSKHDALVGECNGNDCFPSAQGDLDGFHSLKTVSTVGYLVGAIGLAGGGALWFFALRERSTGRDAHLWIGPSSAGVGGVF